MEINLKNNYKIMSFDNKMEIEWLKTEIIPNLLKQQKIIENFKDNDFENFEVKNCEVKVVGVEEAFMLTTCYRAAIEYKFKDANNKINLFVKKTPELSQELFDSVNFKALFTNEMLAYEKLMPALQEFGKIDLKLAKFYYAQLKSNSAVVITDDFSSKQWTVCKQMVNISLQHLLLAVEYLAEFHAVGFAWRKQKPQVFYELTKDLKEPRYTSHLHPSWAIYIRESKKRALDATRKYEPVVAETFLADLKRLWGDTIEYGKERVKRREPMITLCHGDYLRNNMAFKYDRTGQPVDVMMFDLQTLRVTSPMLDLALLLTVSAYAEVRYKHFTKIFTLYSQTLKKTYERLVAGPLPEYLSYNSLLKEYIKYLPYGIDICSAFLMNLVEPKVQTSEELLTSQQTLEEIKQEVMTRGGEEVDRELAHQIKELYELNHKNDANIFQQF